MASANEAPLASQPVRKLARRLLKKTGETPPVDVEAILGRYGELERVVFPFTCDAVVQRSDGKRPKVYLDTRPHEVRQRFTLAHEIGHIVIPWQPGTFVCHTNASYAFHDYFVEMFEKEANAFASELLLPSPWIAERVHSMFADPFANVVDAIATEANVSIQVATIAIPAFAGVAVQLVLTDRMGEIVLDCSSPNLGSSLSFGDRLTPSKTKKALAMGGVHSKVVTGSNTLHAFVYPTPDVFVRPRKNSSALLDEIIHESLGLSGHDRLPLVRIVAGLVGVANNKTINAPTREDRYGALKRKLSHEPKLEHIVSHPRFDDFLKAKAAEMHDRHGKGRR